MTRFYIVSYASAFKSALFCFLIITLAVSNVANATYSDRPLGQEKRKQLQGSEEDEAAAGRVQLATMIHVITNSSASQGLKLPTSAQQKTDLGTETKNKNNWVSVNHDIYGTRSSNQTIINKDNVDKLQVKWRLVNEFEIQDPPIIIDSRGYVQDHAGNILAFDTRTGHVIWKVHAGNGPTTGLAFGDGVLFAS